MNTIPGLVTDLEHFLQNVRFFFVFPRKFHRPFFFRFPKLLVARIQICSRNVIENIIEYEVTQRNQSISDLNMHKRIHQRRPSSPRNSDIAVPIMLGF